MEQWRYQRRLKRLYKAAVGMGLADLGLRMRNETAANPVDGEKMIEDDPVLITDAQAVVGTQWEAGQYGWLVVTTHRARWAQLAESRIREAWLDDLHLFYREDEFDTYQWSDGGRTASVTFGFLRSSDTRAPLHDLVHDHENSELEERGVPDTFDRVWQRIAEHAGESFRLKRAKRFTYEVTGNTLRPSTTNRNIPRKDVEEAFGRLPVGGPGELQDLQGPSYIYAILTDERVHSP